jgi:hypothetical protein
MIENKVKIAANNWLLATASNKDTMLDRLKGENVLQYFGHMPRQPAP